MDSSLTPIQPQALVDAYRRVGRALDKENPGQQTQGAEEGVTSKAENTGDTVELSEDAQREVEKLQTTDRQVRAHEAAHMAAGAGIVTGGATFTLERGPDGKTYAIAGEVGIDASPVPHDPAATITKAQKIRSAALAPADPSAQDRQVAANAARMASQAAQELARQGGASGQVGQNLDLTA